MLLRVGDFEKENKIRSYRILKPKAFSMKICSEGLLAITSQNFSKIRFLLISRVPNIFEDKEIGKEFKNN
jgi:hypothetical protein